jgi:hypothetical protein
MSARELGDPTSSSVVTSRRTLSGMPSAERAKSAWTIPAFMSTTPGPVALPPSTLNGQRASVPRGQTVSTWQRRRARGRPVSQTR